MKISVTSGNPSCLQVRKMLADSDQYYAKLYPAESNHLIDIDTLLMPNIHFFVAQKDDILFGFGALVAMSAYGEIKRMYVDETKRGLGIGQLLLDHIEEKARTLNFSCLRLETGIRQPAAISLYKKNGFVEIEAFGNYNSDSLSLFMEKNLT